jgi:hypothetical protein
VPSFEKKKAAVYDDEQHHQHYKAFGTQPPFLVGIIPRGKPERINLIKVRPSPIVELSDHG